MQLILAIAESNIIAIYKCLKQQTESDDTWGDRKSGKLLLSAFKRRQFAVCDKSDIFLPVCSRPQKHNTHC